MPLRVEGTMRRWQQTTLALGLTLTATPTVAQERIGQDKFELPLNSLGARYDSSMFTHADNSVRMSFGSVGLDSHAGDSRRHQYFNIPDERSFNKVPGVWFKIPLGN
jgi:hypothetical protein